MTIVNRAATAPELLQPASAAISHDREITQRRMYCFSPPPHFNAKWWREKEIGATNILGFPDELFEPGIFSETAWFFHGDHGCDGPSLCGGGSLVFWTATDLILWLRFHALPFTIRSVNAGREVATVMGDIDEALNGTNAEEALVRWVDRLIGDHGLLWIRGVESIHNWLSRQGTVQQFRRTFEDPQIECIGGKWSMDGPTWRNIERSFQEGGYERLSLVG